MQKEIKELSNELYQTTLIENEEKIMIAGKSIVINLAPEDMLVNTVNLKYMKSMLVYSGECLEGKLVLVIKLNEEADIANMFGGNDRVLNEEVKLTEKIIGFTVLCDENVDVGIHREHDFMERHTQLIGSGSMRTYESMDSSTLQNYVPMEVGYTHDPFIQKCGDEYPFHTYISNTKVSFLVLKEFQ